MTKLRLKTTSSINFRGLIMLRLTVPGKNENRHLIRESHSILCCRGLYVTGCQAASEGRFGHDITGRTDHHEHHETRNLVQSAMCRRWDTPAARIPPLSLGRT